MTTHRSLAAQLGVHVISVTSRHLLFSMGEVTGTLHMYGTHFRVKLSLNGRTSMRQWRLLSMEDSTYALGVKAELQQMATTLDGVLR